MSSITIEVPLDEPAALAAAADMLIQLAANKKGTDSAFVKCRKGNEGTDDLFGAPTSNVQSHEKQADGEEPAGKVDAKGVAFDATYCSEAKDPFYPDGAMVGQWKRKRGISPDQYDKWYAGELAKLGERAEAQEHDNAEPGPPAGGTAPAFGGAPPPPAIAPSTAGEFMLWVSQQQAAGLLTQDQVNQAYAGAGVGTADLFGKDAAAAIQKVYTVLNGLMAGC